MKQSTFSAVMANSIKNLLQGYTKGIRFVAILTLLLTLGIGQAWGADVTYKVSTKTTVTTSGTAPTGSSAAYTQTYNTACQITSGNSATLTLTNLGGINISNITLSMKSNTSNGAGKLSYSTDGGSTWTYLVGSSSSGVAFNQSAWNGSYTTSYTNISKNVTISNATKLIIKIEATTNSLYCQSYKLTYTTADTKVTLTKGSVTNGSIALNKTSVTTTSAAQSVTVTCTPNTGYYTKSVSATKPATGNTPTYGGSGNSRTVTYSKGSNGSSTITATFTPAWQLRGTFNNWGTTHPLTSFSENVATVTIDLQAMTEYTFKFVNVSGSSEQWYGNTGAIITDISNWVFSTSTGDNARLYTGPAGTYTFKFNVSTKALQVIYPTVTHPAEGYAYFQKQDSWNGLKVYNFTDDNNRLSDWNGSPSVTNTTIICGKTYYYTALATQFQKVIFRDNGTNQWKEINVSGFSGKYCGDNYNANPQAWKAFNKYSITFNSNGGSGTMSTISGICPGDNQTLPANTFSRTGHTFDGWATSVNGSKVYSDNATISNINSNLTLYARWKANSYTITSTLTDCSSSPTIPTSYTYTGSAANLTYTITPASGYRLPDAITVTGTTYTWDKSSGQLKLTGTINSDVTITIKAIKIHTITWKVNKQTYTTGSPTTSVDDGSTYKNLTLPTAPADNTLDACYTGKKFMGWSTTNIGSTESSKPSILFKTAAEAPSTQITENTTLYAVFATETPTTSTSTGTTTISGAASGTITNVLSWYSAQNEGTAITAWNDNHFRLYPNKSNGNGSSITIQPLSGITIKTVVLTATSTTYAKPVKYNIDGGSDVSGTWSNTDMTISDIDASTSFKFRNAHIGNNNDQVRVTISVTYSKKVSSSEISNYVTECCTLNNITLDGNGTVIGGTFSATANKACKGEEITLSATAAECYEFVSWTIKNTSNGSDVTNSVLNGNTLTMPDYAVTVYATFKSLSVTAIALAMTGGHKNLDVGDTNQLLVAYTPTDATCDKEIVSWTSSEDNVMSVTSDGLVKALRAGDATITATTEGGVTATYTITVNNPVCDSWYIHYWNNSTSGDECFYKVKPDDPNDHEWRTNNFSLPSFSDEDKFIVNNTPEDPYKTDQVFRTGIGFADIQRGGQNCGTNPYPGQDAYGQLSIYDDSETANRYIAFYPAQYLVTYGKADGAAPWEVLPLNNTTGYEYETEPFMVPHGYKTDDTYKYYVGITDKNGNIKYVGYEFGGVEYKKSSVDPMNTVNGLSANDMAGKWGTWHIYSNSCANNWYCEFIHYYRVDFNLNGGEGDFAPRYGKATTPYVTFTTTEIGTPTRTGYTFLGWKDQNNKIYALTDATVTINKDLTLTALWIEEYPSTNCRWEEVTIDDIEYGDEVVVAMEKNESTYALADNNTAASSAPSATEISINANKTINTEETPISNALIWNIDYDKEGTKNLVIYSTKNVGKWLYSNNANDGVRIGDNTNKEFKIVEGTGDDAGNFFLYHIAQNRYLGVYYTNHEWRGYTSINTNITGQTLKLYKKVCLPEGQYRVTWDANGGQWSDGSTTKEEVYAEGATINKPDKPKRDGYEFTEWAPNPTTMPDENTTFTAQWAELHTITWMVGSNSVLTEEVANTTGVTKTPENPTNGAIGECANAFMGWTETPLGSAEGQSAPADLCTAAQMKAKHTSVTGDKIFYAVFATKGSGGIAQGTVLWAENFGHFGTKKPSEAGTGTGTTIYSDASITYSQSSNNTKGYSETYAGGTAPELLLAKSNTTWTIAGIPTGGATKMTLSFLSNKTTFNVTSSTAGITISGEQKTWNITATNEVTEFTLTIKNTGGDNARLDNVSLVVSEGGISYSNYVTNCCALAPATNLTVSGTAANSATLTWTAPSSTTGITKLQVRNAETDTVVVDNIAVNTTTTTINGLTECTSYKYYVVSVGEDCEVVSNIVTAQPFGNAKTVNYNYNGGSGSVTSFTTSCTNQTITLPAATRTGYDFKGWYTAATGGTRVGDAGETYEPATSPVTLYAQWTIKSYTVTWNPNGGNWDGSTSNIVQTYEYGAAIKEPADPKRENGIFKGWNPSVPSTMPAGNKTYTAQWEMVYTLTFVDMNAGGTTTTLTQTSSGQNLVAPTANSEVCDMWTFIGWAPSNSLNGGTDKPTGFIAAGETIPGSQITGNKTYYSVYSYNSDNTQEFEIGKSGTYLMYAISGTTKYYATTAKTGGFYGNPETAFATYGYPSKFKLTYNKTENKYIIYHENTTSGKESSGYFELNTSDGEVDVKSENASLFTIQAGSNESFIIRTDYTDSRGTFKERSFGYDGSFTDYSGDNPIYFEPASEIQYYNAANCGEVETYTMSFHNPFGDENALIWYDAEHEESYYTDKPLNTSIDVFPTMVYNGWAFIGWTANQQYNELIGDDNLDDENSATNDPASALTIYSNTAGWSYKLNSNVTMYPVFTKYEDNEDIDLGSGGEYYMYFYREGDYYKDEYFGADNHYKRMYALAGGGDNGEFKYTTNCNDAQIFEFIKEGDGWNIRVKNADGSYPTKSYLVNTIGNDYDLVATKPSSKWSITKEPEGDYTMWYKGNATNQTTPGFYVAKAREYSGGSSWNFKCYNQDNDASQFYYKVYLGTCENRVFSSNPTNKPAITLSGEPIVTSTQDQSIRAQGELSISATKLAANGTITLTSDNEDVYFSSVKDANFTQATKPVTPLTLYADEKGKLAMTTVYVHYKPTDTSYLGVQTANITATTGTEGEEDYATAETTAQVRNLPAKFVIATKVGATWYALPADMTTASNPLGVVIEVDETNMTATAPNSCTYTLFPVKTTNTVYDRYEEYGDRLRFSAVNNSYKGLWANNSMTDLTINNDMVIDQASDGQTDSEFANNSYYEWKVTTTVVDGHWQYTLQTDQTQNQNYLRYWTSAEGTPIGPKWGTYNAGENKLYFLPVTETQPFEYAVVEWYPTKVLIQTDANIASPTVKVGGEKVESPELTNKGGKLYEISNLPLEINPNKLLQVSFTDDAINYTNTKVVPIILSRGEKTIKGEPFATLTQKVYQYADVVVRDGATLTIDGDTDVANTLLGVTIYPTAKVAVAEGEKLSVHNLTFFGGIDEIYDGSAYTINKYGVPQLSLKGILNKTITNMDYIMRVDLEQMYQVGVPYDVNLKEITYWDGTSIDLGEELYVSAYDGQKRANLESAWVWEVYFAEKVMKAGIGYTISADMQADVGNEYSIIRLPMKSNIASGKTEADKTVQVYAYANKKGVEITDNNKGWNYLSNPYMAAISGAEADSKLVVGYLYRNDVAEPWEWFDDTYRYVTIPSDDGTYYYQQQFKEATLLPFKSFFLQIATDGELSFALASRQDAPARYLQSSNEQREVEFEVLLTNDTRSDNLGFLIGEDYTPAYEINADLEKMIGSMSVYTIYNGYNLAYNALSPTNAAEQIPIGYVVPTVGEYTFALDESSDIEDVEHIYLIDYETSAITDLVTDVYTFTTLEQKSDTRFAINVALKSKESTVTGLVNINKDSEQSLKFIHNDKIYILHNGVIYDATGKFVETINK